MRPLLSPRHCVFVCVGRAIMLLLIFTAVCMCMFARCVCVCCACARRPSARIARHPRLRFRSPGWQDGRADATLFKPTTTTTATALADRWTDSGGGTLLLADPGRAAGSWVGGTQ